MSYRKLEIISLIACTYLMELLSIVPSFDQAIAYGVRSSLVSTLVIEIESCTSKSVLNMIHNRSLDRTLVTADV